MLPGGRTPGARRPNCTRSRRTQPGLRNRSRARTGAPGDEAEHSEAEQNRLRRLGLRACAWGLASFERTAKRAVAGEVSKRVPPINPFQLGFRGPRSGPLRARCQNASLRSTPFNLVFADREAGRCGRGVKTRPSDQPLQESRSWGTSKLTCGLQMSARKLGRPNVRPSSWTNGRVTGGAI
jgi:hypothetical protein